MNMITNNTIKFIRGEAGKGGGVWQLPQAAEPTRQKTGAEMNIWNAKEKIFVLSKF
jgi:hypothetical protein